MVPCAPMSNDTEINVNATSDQGVSHQGGRCEAKYTALSGFLSGRTRD